ncbi:hypothetical protein Forpe1208_v016876 [Fusarium oxysporum f. sp. rapae]|uniref:Uncharacterized protein n=1 Tax=Fusarium oxysporum f. sp. rapae TaxID=485398 RepID=A0A8J5TMP3_FUSOX|nr:hypothetical protein Forpe1208_v016876 [Fusarium oxysporum f. sp. rapae]
MKAHDVGYHDFQRQEFTDLSDLIVCQANRLCVSQQDKMQPRSVDEALVDQVDDRATFQQDGIGAVY